MGGEIFFLRGCSAPSPESQEPFLDRYKQSCEKNGQASYEIVIPKKDKQIQVIGFWINLIFVCVAPCGDLLSLFSVYECFDEINSNLVR